MGRIGDLMLGPKLRRASRHTIVGAIVIVGVLGVATAPAAAPTAPINDDYLTSLEINGAHTPLDRIHTIKDIRSTGEATVQDNIFDPCGQANCPQGPRESTTCHGVH